MAGATTAFRGERVVGMAVQRTVPNEEGAALLELTRELADRELRPRVEEHERRGEMPRELFRVLGKSGLLGLPYPERYGGGGQPYEVYLQVLEELATAWLAVGLGVSVHTLACYPLAAFGTEPQRQEWLPDLLGGDLLGAYCLSESGSGSDAASLSTRALRDGDEFVVTGTKAWVTHGGRADFYDVLVRTAGTGARGVSCPLVEAGTHGMHWQPPERKMGMASSPTAQVVFEQARVPVSRLLGAEGDGFRIAMEALDGVRLGIAACAVGVAQTALDYAAGYPGQRRQFRRPIADFQGVSVLLADMATQVD